MPPADLPLSEDLCRVHTQGLISKEVGMQFGNIDPEQFDEVRDANAKVAIVRGHAKRLTKIMGELLNSDFPVENWGTSFEIGSDGLGGRLASPFGDLRIVVVSSLGAQGVQARYVFEKRVADERGESGHVAVWAVRINSNGSVVTDDEAEELFTLQALSLHERQNGAGRLALSAIYAAAVSGRYSVSEPDPVNG